MSEASFVSVVTPFHNTVDYLERCIRSVLTQSYGNFEYLLCYNASTDGSSDLAKSFATQDPRVRYRRFDELLPQVENYNRALEAVRHDAKYRQPVHADDWIFPERLEKMAKLADRHPEVGMVAAYYLKGASTSGGGDDPEIEVYKGREVCRRKLLTAGSHTGSLTAVMYRADVVRLHRPFFSLGRFHEDLDAGYEILAQHSMGFVPQILCFQRIGNPSILTTAKPFNPGLLDRLLEVETFAPRFLACAEAKRVCGRVRRATRALLTARTAR